MNNSISVKDIKIRSKSVDSNIKRIVEKFNFPRVLNYLKGNNYAYNCTVDNLKRDAENTLKHAHKNKYDSMVYYTDNDGDAIGMLLASYQNNVLTLHFTITEIFAIVEPKEEIEPIQSIPSDKYLGSPLLSLEL